MLGFAAMEKRGIVIYLHLATLISMLPYTVQQSSRGECPCAQSPPHSANNTSDTVREGRSGNIICCASKGQRSNIFWTFNGKNLTTSSSTYTWGSCGPERLMTRSAKITDAGIYKCIISNAEGDPHIRLITLTVEPKQDYFEGPKNASISEDRRARVGATVNFTCKGYVGDNGRTSWRRRLPNGTLRFFKEDSGINTEERRTKDGFIEGKLIIQQVEQKHFGAYTCVVKNDYGTDMRNVSLIDGDPEEVALKLKYQRAVMTVIAAATLLLALAWLWWRCKNSLNLWLTHNTRSQKSSNGYSHDVVVVHGDSVADWVWSYLIPTLEVKYHYKCFLPNRDLKAGEQIAESISSAMHGCRRVLVVITPCLIQSAWASWCIHHGVYQALSSKARILGLLLQEIPKEISDIDAHRLLGVLKVVRKLRVPKGCCQSRTDDHYEPKETKLRDKTDQNSKTEHLKIPEIRIESTSRSNSLNGQQRLSNMISGSNNSSREFIEVEGCNDEKKNGIEERIFFTEDEAMDLQQDPGTPCSITPFIMPSCYGCQEEEHQVCCSPMCMCMRTICVGDPEQMFWQRVRLCLAPPINCQIPSKTSSQVC